MLPPPCHARNARAARPAAGRYRPLCSTACADLDLGHWVTGSYTIPPRASPDDESEGLARPNTRDAHGDDEPSLE